MPYSLPETKPWIMERLQEIAPKTVLDIGAGQGTYADLIKDTFGDSVSVTGVEIWGPYISTYNLHEKYTAILEEDARDIDDFNYDVVIFGDVLEHMSKPDALAIWEKVKAQAKYAVIAIPIIRMPQGAHEGNPYEAHVKDDWTVNEVLSSFSNIEAHERFEMTGAFLAKF